MRTSSTSYTEAQFERDLDFALGRGLRDGMTPWGVLDTVLARIARTPDGGDRDQLVQLARDGFAQLKGGDHV